MSEVTCTIDGIKVTANAGTTILDAARMAGIRIPTLCYLKDVNEIGACRICMVEVKGARNLAAACVYPIAEGMEVMTSTKRVQEVRKRNLQLLLSGHDRHCLSCVRSRTCQLAKLCSTLGITEEEHFETELTPLEKDDSAIHMVRDPQKCILCRRCVSTCEQVQGLGIPGVFGRGYSTRVGCAFEKGLGETACIGCGQCILSCPTGALYERDDTEKVFAALRNPEQFVVVQPAPAVRAALGEEFGLPAGTDVEGKLVTALRMLGFDRVFDTGFSADLTILEETEELLGRLADGGVLPMLTSCSPGWVRYCETCYPDLLSHLSTCKSPQQMFGAVVKNWYAEKIGKCPEEMVCVSVMPCTAKKLEIKRQEREHLPDVDIAITTRELARMIRKAGIDFAALPDGTFDTPLGESTGAAMLFGASGGVMEAALRTAYHKLTGEEAEPLQWSEVRGLSGVREAALTLNGRRLLVAAASSVKLAGKLMEQIRNGACAYQFIELMGCPGGCVNGGGQPIVGDEADRAEVLRLRAEVLYQKDAARTHRRSHENASVNQLYAEWLEKPGGEKPHAFLHTTYQARDIPV